MDPSMQQLQAHDPIEYIHRTGNGGQIHKRPIYLDHPGDMTRRLRQAI